ncbi:MAG TPA: YraN family protein [Paracoccus sp. (in: a-proteobacteria)]|nr:YraN family protein [Paracoccus sp. (in: a-proteobacteria)]
MRNSAAAAPRRPRDHRRVARGLAAHASGHRAEDLVAARYRAEGCELLERCWRSPAGEIDLILRDGGTLVFVEVKRAATREAAAQRIRRPQMDRIGRAALIYCETLPGGSLTEMRFDAALVDEAGGIDILRGSFDW